MPSPHQKPIPGYLGSADILTNGTYFIASKVSLSAIFLNSDQLTAKAQWGERHFNHCVFVCSRDNISRYRRLLNKYPKMICLTTKEARDKIM
ncbi:MAG: hypothetical protein KJ984_04720 [Nanoarchaeota archaeon]|nr:hypothetical protein [Nanoarchaeota archaeon]